MPSHEPEEKSLHGSKSTLPLSPAVPPKARRGHAPAAEPLRAAPVAQSAVFPLQLAQIIQGLVHGADDSARHAAGVALAQETAQLKSAGEILGIDLLDHIIFNRTGYFSFLEDGRLAGMETGS
jgi:hypothetical protein